MSTKSSHERRESVLSAVHYGGKLMFFAAVFLFLFEFVSFFGASARISKVIDVCAMLVTVCLFVVGLLGSRIVLFFCQRLSTESKESGAL